jgi:hypothetical protein
MGAWGTAAWDNDAAADWFQDFFGDLDLNAKIKEAFELEDGYDEIRAACFILGSLGRVYVWKGDLDELTELLEQGIVLLSKMIDANDEENDFLEMWDNNPEVIASVQEQIKELQARRAGIQ